jgi:HEAT repeat protein
MNHYPSLVLVMSCAVSCIRPVSTLRDAVDLPPPWEKDESRIQQGIESDMQKAMRMEEERQEPADERLVFSAPMNGLSARIEPSVFMTEGNVNVFVRLKNVSDRPVTVPTGNPRDPDKPRWFELHVRRGGTWSRSAWFPGEGFDGPGNPKPGVFYVADQTGWRDDRPDVTLGPGESALACLCGEESDDTSAASEIKIVLRCPAATGSRRWHGVLETLPQPAHREEEDLKPYRGVLSCPDHLLSFSRRLFLYGNTFSEEDTHRLFYSNNHYIKLLRLYHARPIRDHMERWMDNEQDGAMRWLIAAEAAKANSQKAARLLLAAMKGTDYKTTVSAHRALFYVLLHQESNPPGWAVELAMAALSDSRCVTHPDYRSSRPLTISYHADETGDLVSILGHTRCRRAVPLLIGMARGLKNGEFEGSRNAVRALGRIGDARAIPVLLELHKALGETVEWKSGFGFTNYFGLVLGALGDLRAAEAVPALLGQLEYPAVIETLKEIGDPRAVVPLERLVAEGGKLLRGGAAVLPELEGERLWTAKTALADLDKRNRTERLCALLKDASSESFDRLIVIGLLGNRPDPRAVGPLIDVIRNDPDGDAVFHAIHALARFKYGAAVQGLIECFDIDFTGKTAAKIVSEQRHFHDVLARSLRAVTRQRFGADKEQWLIWWDEAKRRGEELK